MKDLAEMMEKNFIIQARLFGRSLPGVLWYFEDHDILVKYATGIPGGWLNRIGSYDLAPARLASEIDMVVQDFAALRTTPEWVIGSSQPNRLDLYSALVDRGWIPYGVFHGMAAARDSFVPTSSPNFTVRKVETTDAMEHWLGTFFRGFSVDFDCLPFVRSLYCRPVLDWSFKFENYIAYHNDAPVACGSTHTHCGLTMLYNITTDPVWRFRGAATVLVRHIMQLVFERGAQLVPLFSQSAEVCAFYERLGFKRNESSIELLYLPMR